MKQLGITDAAFINLEHPETPQHIASLGIYDQSTAPDGKVDFSELIKHFERQIKKFPLFRTRLINSPGRFSRPYWHVDDDFDVEFHVRHLAVPAPGDWKQLCKLLGRLHSRPIDLSHPLWESYIIEGINIPHLPNDCFGIYTKVHHSLVDGGGASTFMEAIHELTPEGHIEKLTNIEDAYEAEAEPSYGELWKTSLKNYVNNSWNICKDGVKVTEDMTKSALDLLKGDLPAPPLDAPCTRFNTPVSRHRCMEACEFSLAEFKLIKNKTGTSINDVGLAIIAGGMRRYLEAHSELPESSLVATVPMDMRLRRGEKGGDNNQVGSMFTSLHTDIENPIQRLLAISHSATKAKELGEKSPLADMLKLAGTLSPRMTKRLVNLYVDNKLTSRLPIKVNTVVSNVPGPQIPLYCYGAKLVQYNALGVLTPGVGLFHMLFSYCGTISLTMLGDRKSLPDATFYRSCIEASYKELLYEIKHSEDVDLIKMIRGAGHVGIYSKPPETSNNESTAVYVEPKPEIPVVPHQHAARTKQAKTTTKITRKPASKARSGGSTSAH